MGTILKYLILLSAQGKVSLAFYRPERVLVISGDMMAYRQRYEWGNKKICPFIWSLCFQTKRVFIMSNAKVCQQGLLSS